MDPEIIVAIISGAFGLAGTTAGIIGAVAVRRNGKKSALAAGVLCLLRTEIIRSHDKYTEQQEIPIYAKESIEKMYTSYHDLGGNGTMTDLYNECMALPVKGGRKGETS